jgi:hypothetical protein
MKSQGHALGYKVWVELADLLPYVWSEQEIPILASPFGLVLAHTSLIQLASYERLRLYIATDNLS